jgi:hypothetical protein
VARRHGESGSVTLPVETAASDSGDALGQALSGRAASDRLSEQPYTGACAAPPRPANQGTTFGDRAADQWVPLVSELFQINKLEFHIPPKKNR